MRNCTAAKIAKIMKKRILSAVLATTMVASAIPVAFASNVDYKVGTAVTVVGQGGEYFVTVPAALQPEVPQEYPTAIHMPYDELNLRLLLLRPWHVSIA